jgi:hypothetical protein
VLEDLRVLALRAKPLEVGPGESVTLTPVRLATPGETITEEHWSFCPFSVGGTAGFACAVPACEFPLQPGGDPVDGVTPADGVTVTADPGALAEQCLALLAAQGGAPPSVPSELPAKVNTVFRYRAADSGGKTREAVQLVPFYLGGAPAERNRPPIIQEVDIGGQKVESGGTGPALGPGAQLEFRVLLAPSSVQPYVDDAGRTVEETLVVSFFTTAGRFDFDRANVEFPDGPAASGRASVVLKYEDVRPEDLEAEAQLWAVATDLRGGEAVEGPFLVPVRR